MVKRSSWMLVLLGLLLALAIVPAAFAQSNAKVRVVHASPDAPAVDVLVNGQKVQALTNVPFFTASSYLDLPAGTYDIQVVPTGATTPVVIDAKGVKIDAGKAYTIAASGKLADIKPAVFVDDLTAPAAGKAHVRVYHLSPDAPAVDIAVKGGPVLIPNLAFPNASNYLPVDAGTYDLEVRPTGTTTAALSLAGTKLDAGKIYDVFANGLLSGTPALKVDIATPAPVAATPPTRLPTTSGTELPVALFGLIAVALVAGGLLVRRFAR